MPPEDVAPQPAAPAAEPQAPAPAPAPAGDQRKESFGQTMQRLGGYSPPPSDAEPAEPAATEPKAEPVKPEPKAAKGKKGKAAAAAKKPEPAATEPAPEALAAPAPSKLDQLQALAKELGFELEANRVSVAERHKFRELRRTQQQQLAEQEQAIFAKLDQARQQFGSKLTRAEEIEKAIASLDPDQIAKVAGYESYDKFQEAMLAKATDPNYVRIRQLEQREAERAAADERARQEHERQLAAQSQQQREHRYLGELTTMMKGSKNQVVAALAEDPRFARTVMTIQREHYDPATKSTLSPEQAIKVGVKGAQRALEDEMRGMYERLHKAFGKPEAAAAAQTAAQIIAATTQAPETDKPGAKPRPKTQVAPAAPEAAPSKKLNRVEYAKYFSSRISEAIEADKQHEHTERLRKAANAS